MGPLPPPPPPPPPPELPPPLLDGLLTVPVMVLPAVPLKEPEAVLPVFVEPVRLPLALLPADAPAESVPVTTDAEARDAPPAVSATNIAALTIRFLMLCVMALFLMCD